ncbi:hypothetical protein Bca4012_063697 [Brassica carinata]
MFTLGSFMYGRHEDIVNMVRDGLFGHSRHDNESDGLVNICEGDRDLPVTTERLRGYAPDSYFSEYEWSGGCVRERNMI